MKYHYITTRIAKIKKTNPTKSWQRLRTTITLIHYWWELKWENYFGTVWQFLKKGITPPIWSSHLKLKYLLKRKKIILYKDLQVNGHSNFICNSQELETTQMSIKRQTAKQTMTCTMKYYSAVTKNKLLIHVTSWMHLRITRTSEKVR